MFSSYTKLIWFVLLAGLLLVLMAVINFLTYSSVKLTLEGDHNPIANIVSFEGNKLLPSGEGGANYTERKRFGEYKYDVRGPFIKSITGETTIKPFRATAVPIALEKVSQNDIVYITSGKNINELSDVRFYSSDSTHWFVTYNESTDRSIERVTSVYKYSYEDGSWENLVSGSKIDSGSELLTGAPDGLIKYLGIVASD